ncbi:MAG: sugar phosphate isomerase/epimerase [Spirochaetia bacterium]
MKETIAFQLWTVRSLCGDAPNFASTLAAIRSIGYRAVELAGVSAISPADVRRVLDDTGVRSCCVHADSEQILRDPGAVVAMLRSLGCDSVAYPYPRNQDLSSPEGVARLCRLLSDAGSVFHSEGITFSYHHHNLELQKLDGRPVLQEILDRTDPQHVRVELDTYWLQAGGVDPARWIERCAGRVPFLHIKDFGVDPKGKPVFREIGAGNLDWDGILKAAEKAGCTWLIVEQDDHWSTGDPVASLRTSWTYLENHSHRSAAR